MAERPRRFTGHPLPGLSEDEVGVGFEYGKAPLFQEVPPEVRADLLKRVIP